MHALSLIVAGAVVVIPIVAYLHNRDAREELRHQYNEQIRALQACNNRVDQARKDGERTAFEAIRIALNSSEEIGCDDRT